MNLENAFALLGAIFSLATIGIAAGVIVVAGSIIEVIVALLAILLACAGLGVLYQDYKKE